MGRAFSPQTKSIDLSMHSGFMTYAYQRGRWPGL